MRARWQYPIHARRWRHRSLATRDDLEAGILGRRLRVYAIEQRVLRLALRTPALRRIYYAR